MLTAIKNKTNKNTSPQVIIREEDYDDEDEEVVYVTDSEDEEEGAKKTKSKKKKAAQQQQKQGPNTSLILTKTLAQAMRIINEKKVSTQSFLNPIHKLKVLA